MSKFEMKLRSFGHFERTFWGAVLRQLTSLWSRRHSLTMELFQQDVCACKIAGRRYYMKKGCWEDGEETKRERWCPRRANSPHAAGEKVAFISNSQTTPFNCAKDPSGLSGIRWWAPWSWRLQAELSSLCLAVRTLTAGLQSFDSPLAPTHPHPLLL